jgi:hypothetical protein
LASDLKDLKMVSQEWVYKNIFNMSDDEWKLEQGKVIKDLKLGFRHEQIETEGNDPVKTGESFGTPHDLAQLQQNGDEDGQVGEYGGGGAPEGGFDGAGRPPKTGTYGTDDNPFGRDPLGNKANRRAAKPETSYDKNKQSPLAYEQAKALKTGLSKMKKKTKSCRLLNSSHLITHLCRLFVSHLLKGT